MVLKIWTGLYSVLSQSTCLTDVRTNEQNSPRHTASVFHAAR